MTTPLEFLTAVYMNDKLPLPTRMKAAIEAAPYVHPKLSAIATYATGQDFAELLEHRRLARAKLEGMKVIEAPKEGSSPMVKSAEQVSAEHMTKSFPSIRRRT